MVYLPGYSGANLDAVDIDADCLEGIDAQRVVGYALFKGGRDAKVGYPLDGYGDDIAGRSFHNGRFIQKMREKAATLPL
jgi:squalene monooxygenase